VLAQGVGVPATGYLRDATGSYGPVLGTVVATGLMAAAIVMRVRLPKPLQRPGASHTSRTLTMQGLVIRWLVSAVALYLTSLIVDGVEIDGVIPLLFAAVTIGILNAVVPADHPPPHAAPEHRDPRSLHAGRERLHAVDGIQGGDRLRGDRVLGGARRLAPHVVLHLPHQSADRRDRPDRGRDDARG
jgi:hypothetical protein